MSMCRGVMNTRMTSALAPPSSLRFDAIAPKPKVKADRRGRIVRRSFENLCNWIGRMLIRKTGNKRKPFPLLGERIKGEGGRKLSFR
jgi:hypothetical protein